MERKIIILEKLMRESGCTIRQLALLCEVSYKTIQSDIHEINQTFSCRGCASRIVTQSGRGAALKPFLSEEVSHFIQELKQKNTYTPEQDEEYYVNHIAFRLLQADYLKIEDLCDELGFSRSVLNRLLQKAKADLSERDVTVRSRPHYGLYCAGAEDDIRRFMFEKLVLKKEEQCAALLGSDLSDYFLLKESVLALVKKFDVEISDSTLEQLLLYVEIMAARQQKQKEYSGKWTVEKSSFEYLLSKKIRMQINIFLKKEITEEETEWIYRFIVGKCYKKTGGDIRADSSQINDILAKAFIMIEEKYKYDFKKDIELYTSLSIHLRALTARAKAENYSVNPMLSEVKAYSLLAYDMAVDMALLINERWRINLPDDEISYFAIYFHLAIERKKQKIVPIQVLVVCPAGKGMAELAVQFLKKQFKEYISVIGTCGFYELDDVDFDRIDYVFTMVPIKREIPIPVVEFVLKDNSRNMKRIKMQITGKNSENMPLLIFSGPELFLTDIKGADKEDVLKQIVERVGRHIDMAPDFTGSVLRRERIVPTELEYGYAIPHPLDRDMADRSFFSVTILSNPVKWKKRKVRIVLLTYIKEDAEKLEAFYDSFARLVTNGEYAASLMEKPTYDNLMNIAKHIHQEIS